MINDRIGALLRSVPLVDGHNDLVWKARCEASYDFDRFDLAGDLSGVQTDLPRLRTGGVGAQFWSVWVPSTLPPVEVVTATFEQIDAARTMINKYSTRLGAAYSADDIERVHASGRVASLLGAEGGHSIANSLGTLRAMYALGVRYLTLTHVYNTDWADSATDETKHGGLTDFGRVVVGEMNRLGMLVDLSHVAESTMNDALDTSTAPVIFSHSGARQRCDHVRNVSDSVLSRLADNGGVMMVAFVPPFLTEAARDWDTEFNTEAKRRGLTWSDAEIWTGMPDWLADHPRPRTTVADVADHVEHVREVAGVRHVGLGGDFDGYPFFPDGLEDVTGYPRLLAELASRGWSDDDLAALAGRNLIRVLRDAESVASD